MTFPLCARCSCEVETETALFCYLCRRFHAEECVKLAPPEPVKKPKAKKPAKSKAKSTPPKKGKKNDRPRR